MNFLSSKYSSNQVVFKKIIDSLVLEKKISWIKMDSINNLSPIAQKLLKQPTFILMQVFEKDMHY